MKLTKTKGTKKKGIIKPQRGTIIYKPKSSSSQNILIEFTNPKTEIKTSKTCIILPFSLHQNKFKIDYEKLMKRNKEDSLISIHDLEYITNSLTCSSYYNLKKINEKRCIFLCSSFTIFIFFMFPFFFILKKFWDGDIINPYFLLSILLLIFGAFFVFIGKSLKDFQKDFFENREKDFIRLLKFIDAEMLTRRNLKIELGKYGSYIKIEVVEDSSNYLNTEEISLKINKL